MEEPNLFDKDCSQEARGQRDRSQWLDQIRHDDKGHAFVHDRCVGLEINQHDRLDTYTGTSPMKAHALASDEPTPEERDQMVESSWAVPHRDGILACADAGRRDHCGEHAQGRER